MSELLKSRRLAIGGIERRRLLSLSGAAASGGVGRPSGCAGIEEARRAWAATPPGRGCAMACPASRMPALSPTRGSDFCVAPRRSCAPMTAIPHDSSTAVMTPYRRLASAHLRELPQHRAHALDLRRLVGLDIGHEPEDLGLLRGAWLLHQRLHHRQRTLVVGNHALRETAGRTPRRAPRPGAAICSGVSMPGIIMPSW